MDTTSSFISVRFFFFFFFLQTLLFPYCHLHSLHTCGERSNMSLYIQASILSLPPVKKDCKESRRFAEGLEYIGNCKSPGRRFAGYVADILKMSAEVICQ